MSLTATFNVTKNLDLMVGTPSIHMEGGVFDLDLDTSLVVSVQPTGSALVVSVLGFHVGYVYDSQGLDEEGTT